LNYSGKTSKTWTKRSSRQSLYTCDKNKLLGNILVLSFDFGEETDAPVAQLDRVSDYGSEGWGFKSLQAHHLIFVVKANRVCLKGTRKMAQYSFSLITTRSVGD
jgi:hypothetical protein